MKRKSSSPRAENRRARRDYELFEEYEAGLVLLGTEVKALRQAKGSIAESYIAAEKGGLWLINAQIQPLAHAAAYTGHEVRRPRKLLLHKGQIVKATKQIERKGFSMVPLVLFFNQSGLVKLRCAIGRGRKAHDKRAVLKERAWDRRKLRLIGRDVR